LLICNPSNSPVRTNICATEVASFDAIVCTRTHEDAFSLCGGGWGHFLVLQYGLRISDGAYVIIFEYIETPNGVLTNGIKLLKTSVTPFVLPVTLTMTDMIAHYRTVCGSGLSPTAALCDVSGISVTI